MAGAAVMCARAAYRSGVGLVKVLTAEENRVSIQTILPEAILSTYGVKIDESLFQHMLVLGGHGLMAQRAKFARAFDYEALCFGDEIL